MPAEISAIAEDQSILSPHYVYEPDIIDSTIAIHTATLSVFPFRIAWDHNTGMMQNAGAENFLIATNSFKNNKQFIKLYQSFSEQLEMNADVFFGENNYTLQEKMKISSDAILKIFPDKVSLEVTDGGSIFYKIIKGDTSIFFEHFLIAEDDGPDEAIITVYQNDENILNFGGSLTEVINETNKFFLPHNIRTADFV